MARTKFKWKLAIFSYLILVNVFTKSLPIDTRLPSLITTDNVFKISEIPDVANILRAHAAITEDEVLPTEETPSIDNSTEIIDGNHTDIILNMTRNALLRQDVRPGQNVREYAIEITPTGNSFTGRAVITVELTFATREDPIVLHCDDDLNIQSVMVGVFTETNALQANFDHDEGLLEIEPVQIASSYILIISYSGSLTIAGQGLNQFRALEGPPHLWSMAAHNFNNVNVPTSNVLLYVRPGVSNQESQASVAFNFYFNTLNEWTNKPYFEIQMNQNTQLSILALPDVSVDWYGLSMIGLVKMAEALSKQWFGYVIFPENWRYEWVVSGLGSYAAWDILRTFQNDITGMDVSLLDVNTLFVTEVIQESLLRDGYTSAQVLEPGEDMFDEDVIRDNINGLMKYKTPALFRMMRLILGDESQDFIQSAGRALLAGRYERFGFSSQPHVAFNVPITYTVSTQPNYEVIHPIEMMEGTMTFNMFLDEEEGDYTLFNIQGQGYYRLIDDSLNLARAGRIDYETAFRVVLSMEHETEYAPWKAFIRNMNFLRKRLVALVEEDEDLDPDIYLRMVRRSIGAFEREIGFSPDPALSEPAMVSLTRGLVMDHACRANYQPCIAAAVDWFWDPNNNENVVNPNIPADLRPAVYCTMAREGGDDIISALHDRLNIEPSMYERVVILESLTCSRDGNYVRTFLEETIATNSPYTAEERLSIFKAAAASSYQNAWVALNFIVMRTTEVRSMYGGHAKLEEAIAALGENMADFGQSNDLPAERIAAMVMENQGWENVYMDYVYEWIDENDAPTLIVSSVLIFASCMIALFNH
ncbi:Aminopeptidase N-11 [Operophtera brumata]|uniref:Aminopeptidase N-11 n=1 Tax=Operophtera brumata TaxID=104452 RepID=A0A0L7LHA5_OPEBR|nr:Aminopeptidase N-11 [Operophtera brumata]